MRYDLTVKRVKVVGCVLLADVGAIFRQNNNNNNNKNNNNKKKNQIANSSAVKEKLPVKWISDRIQ